MTSSKFRRTSMLSLAGVTAALLAMPALAGSSAAAPASAPASTSTAVAAAALVPPVRGQDISWPQCPKGTGLPSRPGAGLPMPGSTAKFVIVGMTNGLPFTPNPCLAKQAAWIASHHVYMAPYAVIAYPTTAQLTKYGAAGPYKGTTTTARLRNVGWSQAQYDVARMRAAGLTAPVFWMDVEVYPARPWSSSQARNKAVVDGALAGFRAAGLKVGVYSTRSQWQSIVGAVRYGLAEWHTTGPASLSAAQKACSAASFNGGPTFQVQWWSSTADYDVMCPHYASLSAMQWHFRKF